MKKIICVVLSCLMLLGAVSAFAMENPWIDIDFADMCETAGFELTIPDDAELTACRYNKAGEMLEVVFTLDGHEYCARMASTPETELTDISGMNYEWESVEPAEVCGRTAEIKLAHEGENTIEVINWLDVVPGFVYSVSTVQPDVDGLDMVAIAEMVFVEMQGEA